MERQFKQITALIGEPTRAAIMWTLLDGKAFTATELAITANTSPQNMSMHLAKLIESDLLCVEKQGRHKYYRFSNKEIAYAIEALANLIPNSTISKKSIVEKHSPIKHCRTCYDHLAGKIGVALTDSLLEQKIIVDNNSVFEIGPKGEKWFSDFGIDINEIKKQRRLFLRPCLDWSERRNHIAGSLATSVFNKMLSDDWLRKTNESRAIMITGKGEKKLYEYFKIIL